MEALFRVVRKSDQGKTKRSKIPEGWGENEEPVASDDGVTFYLKYIGSTLVGELEGLETYGDGISARAVHTIIAMAKSAGKKLCKTALTVSGKGVRTMDMTTQDLMFDISIYRISFCTADKTHDKVFAYIARNTTNETMECHAFLCAKTKIAQAVTLTVSQAFSIAQQNWLERKKIKRSLKEATKKKALTKKPSSLAVSSPQHTTTAVLEDPSGNMCAKLISLTPDSDTGRTILDSPSKQQEEPVQSRQNWESFDDGDDIDDMFSQLAEVRGKQLLSSCTDLHEDDLDPGLEQYMGGHACFEAFSRTESNEDLFNL